MIPLNEGDLYLVHELGADYDFLGDQYFVAKLTSEQVKEIETRYKRQRVTGYDLEISLIRDMEVYNYEKVCQEVGLKVKK